MTDIVVAPFTNGDIRDWPPAGFVALIRLLLARGGADWRIRVIGTRTQTIRACAIVRDFDPARVANDCGRLAWPEVLAAVRAAACVIGNNSGITHLAAAHGVPTVCIFAGSHQRTEWRPLGASARTLSRAIGCSPCNLHRTRNCPYAKACLRDISPEEVCAQVLAAMAEAPAPAGRSAPQSGDGALRAMMPNEVMT